MVCQGHFPGTALRGGKPCDARSGPQVQHSLSSHKMAMPTKEPGKVLALCVCVRGAVGVGAGARRTLTRDLCRIFFIFSRKGLYARDEPWPPC